MGDAHPAAHRTRRRDRVLSRLHEIGERDGWRCWLCDDPVDRELPSRDPRSASIDARITKARAKKKRADGADERLAHAGCNTGKGAVDPVVPWPEGLFVIDPATIITSASRLVRKGGREVMARCPTRHDAEETAAWLIDRMSRLHPDVSMTSRIDEGGDQFMVSLCV